MLYFILVILSIFVKLLLQTTAIYYVKANFYTSNFCHPSSHTMRWGRLLIHAYMPDPIEQASDYLNMADGFFTDNTNAWNLFLLKSDKKRLSI